MKIVIDTNVLISGLLNDGVVRRLLRSENIKYLIPEHSLVEVENHLEELSERSGLEYEEIETIFNILMENIEIITEEIVKSRIEESINIMKEIDINDSPFIATALATQSQGIWSFDSHMKKQDKVKVFTIQEINEIV